MTGWPPILTRPWLTGPMPRQRCWTANWTLWRVSREACRSIGLARRALWISAGSEGLGFARARESCFAPNDSTSGMSSTAKQHPTGVRHYRRSRAPASWICATPMWLGEARIGGSIVDIALVQVPLCTFNAVSTVFVWPITSAGFSVWMKCPLSVLVTCLPPRLRASRCWASTQCG